VVEAAGEGDRLERGGDLEVEWRLTIGMGER
jgi:hypothetical protein